MKGCSCFRLWSSAEGNVVAPEEEVTTTTTSVPVITGSSEMQTSAPRRVSALVTAASKTFEEEHPYVKPDAEGAFFVPVESGAVQQRHLDSDDEGEHDNHVSAQMEAEDAAAQIFKPLSRNSHIVSGELVADGGKWLEKADFTPAVVWHAKIFLDDFKSATHCTSDGKMKARRGTPHVKVSELLDSLQQDAG